MAQGEKNPPAMQETQETQVWSLEEEMVTHSSILAWVIPWTEEPGHDLVTKQQQQLQFWAK